MWCDVGQLLRWYPLFMSRTAVALIAQTAVSQPPSFIFAISYVWYASTHKCGMLHRAVTSLCVIVYTILPGVLSYIRVVICCCSSKDSASIIVSYTARTQHFVALCIICVYDTVFAVCFCRCGTAAARMYCVCISPCTSSCSIALQAAYSYSINFWNIVS